MEEKIKKGTKTVQVYPEAFRRKIVEEYIAGGSSQRQLMDKYGLKSKGAIASWTKLYGYVNAANEVLRKPKFENITYSCMPSKTSSDNSLGFELLQKKVAELERQLHDEKLRSEAYQRMIEKAEKELNITIRKKPFSK